MEKERLARENTRRAAHGLPPLAKLAELNSNDTPDPTLAEAAQIAADLSGLGGQYLTKLKAAEQTSATP